MKDDFNVELKNVQTQQEKFYGAWPAQTSSKQAAKYRMDFPQSYYDDT